MIRCKGWDGSARIEVVFLTRRFLYRVVRLTWDNPMTFTQAFTTVSTGVLLLNLLLPNQQIKLKLPTCQLFCLSFSIFSMNFIDIFIKPLGIGGGGRL